VGGGLGVRVGPGRVAVGGARVWVGVSPGGGVKLGASVALAAGVFPVVAVLVGRPAVELSPGVVVGGLLIACVGGSTLCSAVGAVVGSEVGSPVGTGGLSTWVTTANAAASIATSATSPNTARMPNCHLFCTGLRSPPVIGHSRRLIDHSMTAESSTVGRRGQKPGSAGIPSHRQTRCGSPSTPSGRRRLDIARREFELCQLRLSRASVSTETANGVRYNPGQYDKGPLSSIGRAHGLHPWGWRSESSRGHSLLRIAYSVVTGDGRNTQYVIRNTHQVLFDFS
jgi:hypothetical protein